MMSLDWIAIARPYAKAVFELGIAHQALRSWSESLLKLAVIAQQPEAVFFIKRPDVLPEQAAKVFIHVAGLSELNQKHLIQLLAKVGRLGALPAIQVLYEHFRADYEKTIDVQVSSFEPLTDAQQQTLILALKKRLQRDVYLHVDIDKTLLGGAIVHAGDLVVDGSVRGKLHRLNDEVMK